jgi:hypothetical protein
LVDPNRQCTPSQFGRAQSYTEASKIEDLPHPAYSSDLTTSGFFLFRYIKRKLFYYNCESREDLLNAVTEMFSGVNQEMVLNVFEFWVNRLNWVIRREKGQLIFKEKADSD